MSRLRALLVFALFTAGAAAAQEAKPPPAVEPATAPAPAPRLKLKLENPARYAREAPREASKDAADSLPALGGGSSSFQRSPDLRSGPERVYPKDSEAAR